MIVKRVNGRHKCQMYKLKDKLPGHIEMFTQFISAVRKSATLLSRIHLPGQYFADTAVTYTQPARDFAGTHTTRWELHDALPHGKRQRAPIDEDAAELVHSAESCTKPPECTRKK